MRKSWIITGNTTTLKMAQYNKVKYIDPNKIFTNGGENMMPPLEDLNAMAELIVTVLPRTVGIAESDGVTIQLIYATDFRGRNKTIGILHGKDKVYVNDPNSSYMTTEPNTFSLQDSLETNKVCNEMFGISSIDVSYNSFMVPQIDIKFVDIRGLSVFSPEELSRMKGKSSEITKTFFGAFFAFPYPKFNLILKGYYGKPVSYELNLQDFKASFNHEDGSMCIDTKFIGYEESFLNDISMNMLFAAPFTVNGEKYWNEKYASRYTKLFDVYDSIRDALDAGISPEDMGNIAANGNGNTLDSYYAEEDMRLNEERQRFLETNEKIINNISSAACQGSKFSVAFKESEVLAGNYGEFISVSLSGKMGDVYEIPNGIIYKDSGTIVCVSNKFSTKRDINGNMLVTDDALKNNFFNSIAMGNDANAQFTSGVYSTDNIGIIDFGTDRVVNKEFINSTLREIKGGDIASDAAKKLISDILSYGALLPQEHRSLVSLSDTQSPLRVFVYKASSTILEEIDNKINANNSKREESSLEVVNRLNAKLSNTYKSVFTIQGVIETAFAHLDTAMYVIENYVNQIQTDCTNRDRSRLPETYGTAKIFSDMREGMTIIPPFPEITKPVSGMNMGTWPGDEIIVSKPNGNMKEVSLVNEIIEGVKTMSEYGSQTDNRSILFEAANVFQESYEQATELSNFAVQSPIAITDVMANGRFKSDFQPLGFGVENASFGRMTNPHDLLYRLYLRYQLLVMTNKNTQFSKGKPDYNGLGRIDADNFYNILKDNPNCKSISYENLKASLNNAGISNLSDFLSDKKFVSKQTNNENQSPKNIFAYGNYEEDFLDYVFGNGGTYNKETAFQYAENGVHGLCVVGMDEKESTLSTYDLNDDFLRYISKENSTYKIPEKVDLNDKFSMVYYVSGKSIQSTNTLSGIVEGFKNRVKENGLDKGLEYVNEIYLGIKAGFLRNSHYSTYQYQFKGLKCPEFVERYRDSIEEYCKNSGQNDAAMEGIISELFEQHLLVDYGHERVMDNMDSWWNGTSNAFENYMEGFLKRFQEIYQGVGVEDDSVSGNTLEFALNMSSIEEFTEGISVSFYNYLKVLYDRWLSGGFDMSRSLRFDKIKDHLFFIDSYYNKTGYEYVDINKLFIVSRNCLENVEMTLLQFITQVLQDNNYQFFCLQNFMDLSDKTSFENAFKPIPFNECDFTDFSQDFVCVLCNDYADKLNGNEGFKEDSFLLDEEAHYPECITLRDECYTIPAFGVLYGTQYQSYFKEIHVSMEGSQATEPAIKNMFLIAGGAKTKTGGDGKTTIVGQNLFDIYSKNSYTCTVTMMGSAWMQPLMYFCLLNIPMFNGTYLIQKVTHTLDGNNSMTTTITGVRLPNLSQYKMEKNVFNYAVNGLMPSSFPELQNGGVYDEMNNCFFSKYPVNDGVSIENTGRTEMENIKASDNVSWMPQTNTFDNLYEYVIVGVFNEAINTYGWRSGETNKLATIANSVWQLRQKYGSWNIFLDKDVVGSYYPNWKNGTAPFSSYTASYKTDYEAVKRIFEGDASVAMKFNTDSGTSFVYENKEYAFQSIDMSKKYSSSYRIYPIPERGKFTVPERKTNIDVLGKVDNLVMVKISDSEMKDDLEKNTGMSLHDAIMKSLATSPSLKMKNVYSFKKTGENNEGDSRIYVLEDKKDTNNKNVAAFAMILNSYSDHIKEIRWISNENDETGKLDKIQVQIWPRTNSDDEFIVQRGTLSGGSYSNFIPKDYSNVANSDKKDFFVRCMKSKYNGDIALMKQYAPYNFTGESDYYNLLKANPAFACYVERNGFNLDANGNCPEITNETWGIMCHGTSII